MFRYAQLNQDGVVVGISQLSGEVDLPNMLLLSENQQFVGLGWRYVDGGWLEPIPVEPEPIQAEPTLDEIKEMQLVIMAALADIFEMIQ